MSNAFKLILINNDNTQTFTNYFNDYESFLHQRRIFEYHYIFIKEEEITNDLNVITSSYAVFIDGDSIITC